MTSPLRTYGTEEAWRKTRQTDRMMMMMHTRTRARAFEGWPTVLVYQVSRRKQLQWPLGQTITCHYAQQWRLFSVILTSLSEACTAKGARPHVSEPCRTLCEALFVISEKIAAIKCWSGLVLCLGRTKWNLTAKQELSNCWGARSIKHPYFPAFTIHILYDSKYFVYNQGNGRYSTKH